VAHPKHEDVRRRYQARCGYCGVSESDTGGELSVDHFRPLSAQGDDSDDNLVYTCIRCNLYKGDFWPSAKDLRLGCRLLHPLRDVLARHLQLNEQTGKLEPLTQTGRFHIALLHLNRPPLVAHRLRRRRAALLTEMQHVLEADIHQLQELLAAQRAFLHQLRRTLGLPPTTE
jgi:hypothetical protein